MYRMNLNADILYDPDLENYIVEKAMLKMSANKLATLTFTLYNNNPQYNQINKLRDVITVYRDDVIIAAVRPVKTKLNFRGGLEYTCEDVLARLNDILRRPRKVTGVTQAAYLEGLVSDYNAQYSAVTPVPTISVPLRNGSRGSSVRYMQSALVQIGYKLPRFGVDGMFGSETEAAVKAFQRDYSLTDDGIFSYEERDILIGLITPEPVTVSPVIFAFGSAPHSDGETYDFDNTEYIGYWDLIQKQLVEEYGGYIRPSYSIDSETGQLVCSIVYTDDEHLETSQQEITFGENLSDLFVETDSNETFSVLVPLGKDVGKNTPQTIATTEDPKDYLESEIGLALYGRREKTYRWDDVSNKTKLRELAQAYLDENAVQLKEKITLSAIDMRYAGVDIEYLDFLTNVRVSSPNHDIDTYYPITEMQISLNSPTASKLTIGAESVTFTDRMMNNVNTATAENRKINARLYDLENPD